MTPDHAAQADLDVAIIGGGQAGLGIAYYLRRTNLRFAVFDAADRPGGAWLHGWTSLRLFSPAAYSALPGYPMPASKSGEFPSRDEVLDYLTTYEERYTLPVVRPALVTRVEGQDPFLALHFSDGTKRTARAVVSATGTYGAPHVPGYPGQDLFAGRQIHSAQYHSPNAFAGLRVLVVGGGNSGAQIHAELSECAQSTWVTQTPPKFLPDDVDGHVLFTRATDRLKEDFQQDARTTLGDIVMVPPVKAARDRGDLTSVRPFQRFTETGVIWKDGTGETIDAVIWCTGFEPATGHLEPLGIVDAAGRVKVEGQHSLEEPRLWLTGYGNWTGPASATLIGASRIARSLVPQIATELQTEVEPSA